MQGAACLAGDAHDAGVRPILSGMNSRGYLDTVRRRLDPALVAYTSDPAGRSVLEGTLKSWHDACAKVGVSADGDEDRAVAVSVLLSFLSDWSESAEDMRDRAATMVLAIMGDGTDDGGLGV